MTYTELAGIAMVAAAGNDLLLTRTQLVTRRSFWAAYAVLLGFQLVVNGVLTGVPIVRYAPDTVLGARLAYAPIEDLAFGFALILTTLSCWVALGRRSATRSPTRRP